MVNLRGPRIACILRMIIFFKVINFSGKNRAAKIMATPMLNLITETSRFNVIQQ